MSNGGDVIDEYDAIYVGIGCCVPNELGISGKDAEGMVNRQPPTHGTDAAGGR